MIRWTDYLRYRAAVRGFSLEEVERLLRFADERYFDTVTGRNAVVGVCGGRLVLVPYDVDGEEVTPVTVHATTRQQIRFRLQTGRFRHG